MRKILVLFLLAVSYVSYGQSMVSGAVKDSHNEHLYGVTVKVKRTSKVTVTDIDGSYSIEALPTDVLIFSAIGHKTLEVPVNGRTKVDIQMGESTETLEDMIVVAYGVQSKASFTGVADVVGAEKLATAAPVESVDKALQGKAAGLRVSQASGDPGATGEIQIRGIGSINASTQPLYVIDGVPMITGDLTGVSASNPQNILSSINMEDIASITVLKDAAAASLYGSRAANGVIIINTKKGKSGETKFNFKSSWSVGNFAETKSFDVMNAQQYVEYSRDNHFNRFMYDRQALPGMLNSENYNLYTEGAKKYANERLKQYNGIYPSDFDAYDKDQVDKLRTFNVKDYILNNASVVQDYQFSVSGGDERTKMFSSLSYNNNQGIVRYVEFERLTGRVNVDRKITENMNLSLSELLAFTKQRGPMVGVNSGTAYSNNPYYQLINWNPLTSPWDHNGKENQDILNNRYNPITDTKINTIITDVMRSMSNVSFDWNMIKSQEYGNISFKSNFGYDYVATDNTQFRDPTTQGGMFITPQGDVRLSKTVNTVLTNNNVLSYHLDIDKSNITVLLGNEIDYRNLDLLYNSARGYIRGDLPVIGAAAVMSSFEGWNRKQRLQSYFSKIDYGFDNKYYFGASFRTDGSSMLAKDARWGNFWSLSGSWRISKESFMSDVDFINDLKIKASYGSNGTLPSQFFMFDNYYTLTGNYNDNPVAWLSTMGNANLSWEKSNNLNVGIDFKIFDILSGSIDYYNKITNDLLMNVPVSYVVGTILPSATNFGTQLQNNGKILNDGIELLLTSNNIKTDDFSWTTTFNGTYMRTEVLSLSGGQDVIVDGVYMYREGMPMYTFYASDYVGLNPVTGEAIFAKNTPYTDPVTGVEDLKNIIDRRYTTNRPDVRANAIDKKGYPDFSGSLTNEFTYNLGKDIGNLSLSFMFTYSLGGWMIDRTTTWGQSDGGQSLTDRNAWATSFDYWRNPGDNSYTPMPIAGNPRSTSGGDRSIFSTDHIRLKDLQLGYSLPSSICKEIMLEGIKISVSGANLLTFSYLSDLGIDPEVPIQGFRALRTPPLKTFTVSLNVNF